MKILVSKITALWLCLLCLGLNAQSVEKKEITIKIMKEVDGKMTEVNKTFTDINDPELQKLLQENQIDIDIDNEEMTSGETEMKIKVKEKDGKQNKQVIIKKSKSGDNIIMKDNHDSEDSDMIWIQDKDAKKEAKAFFGVMSGMEKSVEIIDGERLEKSSQDQRGMKVDKVIDDSGAEKAGLMANDILTEVDKRTVNSIDDLIDAISDKKPGDKVKVKYLRNNQSKKTTVTLTEKPKRKHGHNHYHGARRFKNFEDMGELKDFLENNEIKEGIELFNNNSDEDIDVFFFDRGDSEDLDIKIEELLNRVQNLNNTSDNSLRVMVMIKDLETGDDAYISKRADKYSSLELDNLSFFPNPSSGTFELEFTLPEIGDTDVRILDMNGQELYSRSLSQFSGSFKELIDISEREKGVYILEVLQNKKMMHKKIVVQ